MNEQHQYNLDYFHALAEGEAPQFLSEFTHQQLDHLRHFVDSVITREEDGLNKLYESMAMMMKYVPNFILHSIAPKYIEPTIAARITSKLTIKQILGVTAGLPIEYIGDSAVNMDSALSAEVLAGLKKKTALQVIEYTSKAHPLAMLDILAHAQPSVRAHATRFFDIDQLEKAGLNPDRQKTITALKLAH
ncbi:hypothetical protein [Alkalimarinus coralli]|uniref:hypothetical protein n=1 Tax=Alkalimarinus coralli TaxID=2935863 RepID=UPI00202B1C96|nr:hypothetical protein [Alkalimarinus coralli]